MRHVIWSILVYYLLLLDLTQDGFMDLETMCRDFFLGFRKRGQPQDSSYFLGDSDSPSYSRWIGHFQISESGLHSQALQC